MGTIYILELELVQVFVTALDISELALTQNLKWCCGAGVHGVRFGFTRRNLLLFLVRSQNAQELVKIECKTLGSNV